MTDDSELPEDLEYDPSTQPGSSRIWLNLLEDSEKAFADYHKRVDNIDKEYANLEKLANAVRDREFQMFWANIQVVGPSIYSRPPVPVVVQRFRERRPIPQKTAELLERSTIVTFEREDVDGVMRLIRDDLIIGGRGVPRLRYDKDKSGEHACVDHVDRHDFRHDPARKWAEVGWVAFRAWLNRKEMRKRFAKTSGKAYRDAAYAQRKADRDNSASDPMMKAGVWEIWSKTENKVFWVTEGVDVLLDESEPHLTLDGFFPCPKPAYSTVQRRSLVPVPDMLFYKDQLEEINELTARIAALAEAIKVRFLYPGGMGDVGEALETAMKSNSDNAMGIPVSNWAAFGGTAPKDAIVWLPVDMIVTTVKDLIGTRQQIIADVYQISGLSDIMRGATDPNETLGAQELKSQYGSIRVRDRQAELVRVARDITRMAAEIMAENFSPKTLLDMSQMELPTDAEIAAKMKQIEAQAQQVAVGVQQQVQQAASNPQIMQQAQANPEAAQKMLEQAKQQAQQQIAALQEQAKELQETVTIDQCMALLREQRVRPFVLDIETDSTIAPDENAQKQRATEFITAMGGFLNQAVQGVTAVPQIAPLMADSLKFVASQFRAGRELDASIDEFAEQMKEMAKQPKADPAQAGMQAEQQRMQAETAMKQADMQAKAQQSEADAQLKMQQAKQDAQIKQAQFETELQVKGTEAQIKFAMMQADEQRAAEAHQQAMQKGGLELEKLRLEIARIGVQTQSDAAKTKADLAGKAQAADIAHEQAETARKEAAEEKATADA